MFGAHAFAWPLFGGGPVDPAATPPAENLIAWARRRGTTAGDPVRGSRASDAWRRSLDPDDPQRRTKEPV